MIPQNTIDLILDTAKIEDVISDFVNLKRRGVNMIGVCPFHDEKTPSFIVSPTKGIYKCFGCGKAGNVSKFIMEHESVGYYEALRFLAKKYNIEIQEREITQEEREAKQLSESLYILNNFAAKYFEKQLFETNEGRSVGLSYFKERGFLESTIKKWNLGFSSSSGYDFIKEAKKAQYSENVLQQSGLITRNDRDFFNSRVMFCIHNISGKIVAFAGRTLSKDKKQPKYINSPETEVYEKRKTLFGLNFAKTPIRREDECLLVEGYTDVITLSQGGIENVVASSGTSLTSSQITLIKRFTHNISIIYDGDPAGIMAALRGLDLVLEENMNVRLVLLPKGEDPDSFFTKSGIEGFKDYIRSESKDFILFKTDLLLSEAGNDPIKRSRVVTDIVSSIARIPNPISRSNYVKVCGELLNVNEDLLVAEIRKQVDNLKEEKARNYRREQQIAKQKSFEQNTIVDEGWTIEGPLVPLPEEPPELSKNKFDFFKDEHQERDLVRILVNGGDAYYNKEKHITVAMYLIHNLKDSLDEFQNPLYKKFFNIAIEAQNNKQVVNHKLFTNNTDEDIQQVAVNITSFPYSLADWESRGVYLQTQKRPEENFEKDAYQSILRFKLRKAQAMIDQFTHEIKHSELSDEDRILNIKILQQLQKDKNQIMSALNQTIS
jgi:DNA primase